MHKPNSLSRENWNLKKAALISSGILSPLGGMALAQKAEAEPVKNSGAIERIHHDEAELLTLFRGVEDNSRQPHSKVKIQQTAEERVYVVREAMPNHATSTFFSFVKNGQTKPYKYELKQDTKYGVLDDTYFVTGKQPGKMIMKGPAGNGMTKVVVVDTKGHYSETLNGKPVQKGTIKVSTVEYEVIFGFLRSAADVVTALEKTPAA